MSADRQTAARLCQGPCTRSCAQDANAELLHARLQRGPVHAQEGCGSVGVRTGQHGIAKATFFGLNKRIVPIQLFRS